LAEDGVILGRIAIAVDRPDAEAFPGLGFAEDVVAGGAREEIAGGEAEISEGVVGAIRLEQLVEDVEGANLGRAPVGVNAAGVVGDDVQRQLAVDLDGRLIEDAEVFLCDFKN
jgi:hypothetical protein